MSDAEGIKWQMTPVGWVRLAKKQQERGAGASWKIAPPQWSDHEIPSVLRLVRRKTDGFKGWYDAGESATGTFESVRDLLAWIEQQEQEEWEARIVTSSTNALGRGDPYSISS